MSDSVIHQLYCTHCTFGTSALHRNTGKIQDQPFEYSTRAGSIDAAESHQTFQQFEKLYFRGLPLPSDTPSEARQRLTGKTSPWRRLVGASMPGGSLLAHSAYRTTDTSNPPRTGSYFAHLLFHRPLLPTDRAWTLADALQMWGANFWVLEDHRDLPYDLPSVRDLQELPGFGRAINDQALLSFLTTPAGGQFVDGALPESPDDIASDCVIPQRWRQRAVEDRRSLFTSLLQGLVQLNLDRRERLWLAIEPSVAALLFYGMIRLLPRSGLVGQITFSTFEPHNESSSFVLTATDFFDPAASDLPAAAYRSGLAINTYSPRPWPVLSSTPFVSTMLRWLFAPEHGLKKIDSLRATLEQLGISSIPDCEQYLAADDLADRMVQSGSATPVTPREVSAVMKDVVRLRFRQRLHHNLSGLPLTHAFWSELPQSPALTTQLVRLLSEQPALENSQETLKSLSDCVPSQELGHFVQDSSISDEIRLGRLKREIHKTGSFPASCEVLWAPVRGSGSLDRPLVERLFEDLDPIQVNRLCRSMLDSSTVPKDITSPRMLAMLICYARSAKSNPHKMGFLVKCLCDQRFGDEQWDVLLLNPELRTLLLNIFPLGQPRLKEQLHRILNDLLQTPNFSRRIDVLKAAGDRIADRQSEINSWSRIRAFVQELDSIAAEPSSLVDRWVKGGNEKRFHEIGTKIADEYRRMQLIVHSQQFTRGDVITLAHFVRQCMSSGELPPSVMKAMDQIAVKFLPQPKRSRAPSSGHESGWMATAKVWLLWTVTAFVALVMSAALWKYRHNIEGWLFVDDTSIPGPDRTLVQDTSNADQSKFDSTSSDDMTNNDILEHGSDGPAAATPAAATPAAATPAAATPAAATPAAATPTPAAATPTPAAATPTPPVKKWPNEFYFADDKIPLSETDPSRSIPGIVDEIYFLSPAGSDSKVLTVCGHGTKSLKVSCGDDENIFISAEVVGDGVTVTMVGKWPEAPNAILSFSAIATRKGDRLKCYCFHLPIGESYLPIKSNTPCRATKDGPNAFMLMQDEELKKRWLFLAPEKSESYRLAVGQAKIHMKNSPWEIPSKHPQTIINLPPDLLELIFSSGGSLSCERSGELTWQKTTVEQRFRPITSFKEVLERLEEARRLEEYFAGLQRTGRQFANADVDSEEKREKFKRYCTLTGHGSEVSTEKDYGKFEKDSKALFQKISGVNLSDNLEARRESLNSSKLAKAFKLLKGGIQLECDLYLVLDTDTSDDKMVVEDGQIVRGVAIKLASWRKPQ